MDRSPHNLTGLFEQLGIQSDDSSIEQFITQHRLDQQTLISEASFWRPAQAAFLRESLQEDSDWSGPIDELDTLLRK